MFKEKTTMNIRRIIIITLVLTLSLLGCTEKKNRLNEDDLIWVLQKRWDDGKWSDHKRITNRYNESNHLIEVLFEFNNGTEWKNDYKIEYDNDSTGREIEYLGKIWQDSVWMDSYRYLSYYNADKKSIMIGIVSDSGSWKLSSATLLNYSNEKLMSEKSFQIMDGTWNASYESSYEHFEDLELLTGYTIGSKSKKKSSRSKTLFDKTGRKERVENYRFKDNNELLISITYHMYYDDNVEIRLIKKVINKDSTINFNKSILHYAGSGCTIENCVH